MVIATYKQVLPYEIAVQGFTGSSGRNYGIPGLEPIAHLPPFHVVDELYLVIMSSS